MRSARMSAFQSLGLVTVKIRIRRSVLPQIEAFGFLADSLSGQIMKMLFSSTNRTEVKQVKKKLGDAGIRCEVRNNRVAQGIFGIPSYPELWVSEDSDILKALEIVGQPRLREMTVIFADR
jgi:hypothetical protein